VLYVAEMEPGILDDVVLGLANREEVPLPGGAIDCGVRLTLIRYLVASW
jgi:hypothetical protein